MGRGIWRFATGRLIVDPYSGAGAFIRVLAKIRGFGRLVAAPTGRYTKNSTYHSLSGGTVAMKMLINSQSGIFWQQPFQLGQGRFPDGLDGLELL